MSWAHELKAWLRKKEKDVLGREWSDVSPFVDNNMKQGNTQTGAYGSIDVNWEELDKAIDEFCATMGGCGECREKITREIVEKKP